MTERFQQSRHKVPLPVQPVLQLPDPPAPAHLEAQRHMLQRFTARSQTAQRQAAAPVLRAASLDRQEQGRLTGERATLQRQISTLDKAALAQQPAQPPVPVKPTTPADWVTVMRERADNMQGQRLDTRAFGEFQTLQRQVAQTLAHSFRSDRGDAQARYATYGEHLATLQRHALSAPVSRVVLGMVSPSERLPLQRAADEALQRQLAQEQAALNFGTLSSLQRQLAELDAETTQPVLQRIQARRGAGNPLPEAIQRHLEGGLNHDLSRVRIHDDAEADKLAKGVNAVAFTTGTDIFFQAGRFNPNTQTGLELLAHEVTHTVQQSQGRVGKGIDPDAGLESEARAMGAKLARVMPNPKSLMPPSAHAPGVYTRKAALQRAQGETVQTFALKPLYDLQSHAVQRLGNPLTFLADKAKSGIASALGAIPGYRELTLAFGKDLVTGKTMTSNPNAILDALARWIPGPLKDVLKALRETNAVPKAWAWFKAELEKLNLGGALSEVNRAIGKADLNGAKNAVTRRIGGLKALIVGSARKIADIGLTALAAGLGPAGQQIVAHLRQGGDLILQVLKNPAKFAGNLLKALKGGFSKFAGNAPKHLQSGLGQWLSGTSGITFPAKLDLPGVFMTALSVMGLTYQALRGRLVRAMGPNGEKQVRAAEGTLDTLKTLKGGLHRADELKTNQGPISTEVVSGLKTEVTKSVVTAGITKVASMLIPGGGFVQALLGAFRSVQFLVEQGKQIMGVVTSAIQSVGAIAAGNIGAAVARVESTLARSIPVALGFLSKVLGLGNIGAKVKGVIGRVRGKLDALLDRATTRLTSLVRRLTRTNQPGAKQAQATAPVPDGIYGKVQFQVLKESHSVWTDVRDAKPEIYIASVPAKAAAQLSKFKKEAVALQIYPQVKEYFADAGQAVSTGMAIMRRALTSTNPSTRLQIDVPATEASNRIARYVGVIRRCIQQAREQPVRMPQVKIAFSADNYPNDVREYRLQLFEQQTGINKYSLQLWQAQRSAFIANGRGSATAQDQARRARRALLLNTFQSRLQRDNPTLSLVAARTEARRLAEAWLRTQAALHAPDQIAGSQAKEIVALGRREINGSIGGSWPSRIGILDQAVSAFCAAHPGLDQKVVKMNVRLHL